MILNQEILKKYKPSITDICENLNTYMVEAEQIDFKDFVGENMYFDFLSNQKDERYIRLIRGCEYKREVDGYTLNVHYVGAEKMIAYYAYARIIRSYGIHVSKHGIVEGEFEDSVSLSEKKKNAISQLNIDTADSYRNEVKNFIEENINDYPLYKGVNKKNKRTFFAL